MRSNGKHRLREETSAVQSNKFAIKGTPVGGGDQLRLQNAVLDGEPSKELVADQEDTTMQNQPLGVMLKIVQNTQKKKQLMNQQKKTAEAVGVQAGERPD